MAGFILPRGGGPIPATAPPPILDTVACDAGGAAYSTSFLLRTAYAGQAFQLQDVESTVTTTHDIGFTGALVNASAADTFVAAADAPPAAQPGSKLDYDQCGNARTATSPGGIMPWTPLNATGTGANVGGGAQPLSANLRAENSDTKSSFSNINQYHSIPSGVVLHPDALSVAILARPGSCYPNAKKALWGLGTTTGTNVAAYLSATGGLNIELGALTSDLQFGCVEAGPALYLVTTSASQVCVYVNDLDLTCQTKTTIGGTVAGGFIGNCFPDCGSMTGGLDVFATIFWDHTLTSGEIASVRAWAYNRLGSPQLVTRKWIRVGDSRCEPAEVFNNRSAQVEAQLLLNHAVRAWDLCTDGITAATLDTNFSTKVAPFIANGDLVSIQAGTNDNPNACSNGVDCSPWNSIAGMVTKAHAAASSVSVIAETLPAVGASSYAGFNTNMISFGTTAVGSGSPYTKGGLGADVVGNSWTAAGTTAFIGATSTPTAGAGIITDCYPVDTIHPGTPCQQKWAVPLASAINGLFP